MNYIITGKNVALTDALKATVEKKMGKLEKYFTGDVEAHITLSVQKTKQIVEVTIPFNGMILRAEESTGDMYSSIDNVVEKIEKQIIKHKTKLEKQVREGAIKFAELPKYDFEEDEIDIKKVKRFSLKPMHVDEAVLQMELLGHDFFVFKNSETDDVNVVYKRKDGGYGLIEPEF
ncbi:ribosome hibernation-promoting factor, HPF/YfiA family [Thermobrachium celere]|uniref:Ribosome hibernation promoting factor n=1 Tax=Thermobrachium celere DSM 8682 TaxID=941824 RepID=R7RME3_9CLOT|nr:ribosome-associated translation inhibitor RaiA [Thermobrachium celere]GFR35622.1 ribosome-associated protein [Thermobrachium celere]CDF57347.1 Ribosomal subunit interface protein [Thermobrachium celere DSM 8682]